jgi:hypothetical protein
VTIQDDAGIPAYELDFRLVKLIFKLVKKLFFPNLQSPGGTTALSLTLLFSPYTTAHLFEQ